MALKYMCQYSTNVTLVDVVDDSARGAVTVGSDPTGIAIGMVPVIEIIDY
ncbi:hypothetical protein [Lutispora thermophila]|nr:hypothetical protein [Lutispora thermophila]